MVRLKTRYVLVRLDFFERKKKDGVIIVSSQQHSQEQPAYYNDWFPTRKDFANALRESIIGGFGTSASDAAMDVQGT
jgi:hypothetical protein